MIARKKKINDPMIVFVRIACAIIIIFIVARNEAECGKPRQQQQQQQQRHAAFVIKQRHPLHRPHTQQLANFRDRKATCNSLFFRSRQYQRKNLYAHILHSKRKKKEEDGEDDNFKKPGMDEAFRQLEALNSLDGIDNTSTNKVSPKKKAGIAAQTPSTLSTLAAAESSIPLEKEIETYKDMMNEVQSNEEAEAYAELMVDLGGSSQSVLGDTYTEVILDLGGRPQPKKPTSETPAETTTIIMNPSDIPLTAADSTDKFMKDALQEAMKEVSINNPTISKSILDDREIMKEIEAIFEQGNEKLMASLDEIRKEQEELARMSAERNARKAVNDITNDAQRIMDAETTMQNILQRVSAETKEVELAVSELNQANEELDKDFLYKLKKGGLPKQSALIGFLLFSIRSILDTITALQGDESYLLAALIQGAIAIVCAAVFFLL